MDRPERFRPDPVAGTCAWVTTLVRPLVAVALLPFRPVAGNQAASQDWTFAPRLSSTPELVLACAGGGARASRTARNRALTTRRWDRLDGMTILHSRGGLDASMAPSGPGLRSSVSQFPDRKALFRGCVSLMFGAASASGSRGEMMRMTHHRRAGALDRLVAVAKWVRVGHYMTE